MKRSVQVLVWLYGRLLSLYPQQYRAEYGEELQAVFGLVANEATQQGTFSVIRLGWRELRDLPGAAIREHWQERIKSIRRRKMKTKMSVSPPFEPASWREGLATTTPFLLLGLTSLVHYLAYSLNPTPPRWLGIIRFGLPLISILLLAILGVIKGLPRWSLPYAGLAGSFISMGFTDYTINRILHFWAPWITLHSRGSWALRSVCNQGVTWLGLLGIVVFTVLISAGWRPLRPFYRRIRDDWTLLSFGMYGAALIGLLLTFDDYPYHGPYTAVASLLLAAGAWAYLRSARSWQRFLSLFAGVTLSMAVAATGKGIIYIYYWPGRRHFTWQTEVGSTVVLWGWLVAMILLPALLTLGLARTARLAGSGIPRAPARKEKKKNGNNIQTRIVA